MMAEGKTNVRLELCSKYILLPITRIQMISDILF